MSVHNFRQTVSAGRLRLSTRIATGTAIPGLALLLLSSFWRFYRLGTARHSYDNGYPSFDALQMLDGSELLTIGQPSSIFLSNPVLMSYLQAIPLLVWRSPWPIYLFIVTLNSLAVWLVYRVAGEFLGRRIGFLAGLLMAINPWLIHFSRTTWVQGLLPFFTALIAWGIWPTLVDDRHHGRRVYLGGLAVTALTQSYIQAWVILAPVGLLVLGFWRRIPRRPLLASLLIFGAGMAVYTVGLAGQWENNQPKLAAFIAEESRWTSQAVEHAFRLVTGHDYAGAVTAEPVATFAVRERATRVAAYVLTLALIAGVVQAARALRHPGAGRRLSIVLLVWFAVPILLMSVARDRVHPHYLLVTSPAGYILAALGLAPLFDRRPTRVLATAGLLVTSLLFGLNLHRAAEISAATPTGSHFNDWNLSAGGELGETIRNLAPFAGQNVQSRRVYAEGHEALLSSLSGLYIPNTLQELAFPAFAVLPGDAPLLYVLDSVPIDEAILGPRQRAFPESTLSYPDGRQIQFREVLPYSREEALALPDTAVDWTSEAGLTLLGYTLSGRLTPGGLLQVTTYWRVEELHPQRGEWHIGAFYHLVDEQHQIVTNLSPHSLWGDTWRLNDVYVERVEVAVPEDMSGRSAQLAIGLLDDVQPRNYPLFSPDGPVQTLTVPLRVE